MGNHGSAPVRGLSFEFAMPSSGDPSDVSEITSRNP